MKAKLFQAVLVCLAAFLGAALVQWVSAGKAVGQETDTIKADTAYSQIIGYNTEGKRTYHILSNGWGSVTDTGIVADSYAGYPRYSCYLEVKKGGLYVFDQETGSLWFNLAGTTTLKTVSYEGAN